MKNGYGSLTNFPHRFLLYSSVELQMKEDMALTFGGQLLKGQALNLAVQHIPFKMPYKIFKMLKYSIQCFLCDFMGV